MLTRRGRLLRSHDWSYGCCGNMNVILLMFFGGWLFVFLFFLPLFFCCWYFSAFVSLLWPSLHYHFSPLTRLCAVHVLSNIYNPTRQSNKKRRKEIEVKNKKNKMMKDIKRNEWWMLQCLVKALILIGDHYVQVRDGRWFLLLAALSSHPPFVLFDFSATNWSTCSCRRRRRWGETNEIIANLSEKHHPLVLFICLFLPYF